MKYILIIYYIFHLFKVYPQAEDPELSLNGIKLLDSKSVLEKLGDSTWTYLHEDTLERMIVILTNNANTQQAILVSHYGGKKNEFHEIEVSYIDQKNYQNKSTFYCAEYDSFITSKGIRLGLNQSRLECIIKKELIFIEEKNKINIYKSQKEDTNFYMEKYNLPSYYMRFYFLDNKLIKFSFGFNEM